MRSRYAIALLTGAVLLGLLSGWQLGWFGKRTPGWNVLLISIDSLRRDRLGVYGHAPEYAPGVQVSPNLDALALEGAVFDAAWSTTSWTLPAHMALFTGLSDRLHGVESDEYALSPARRTLPQVFRAAGYRTAGVYSGPYLDPRYGFGRGFERYESAMASIEEKARWIEDYDRRRVLRGLPPLGPGELRGLLDRASHWDVTSPRVNAKAVEFLQGCDPDEPFFLFLHYFDVHFDHLPEKAEPGLGDRFDPAYAGEFGGENWFFDERVRDLESGERRIGERDLHHVMAMYDAEVHWVDRHVGALLAALQGQGLADNTIVCVVSDHGDEFFEHGSIGHRSTLYEELTRIPLILHVPGATPPGRRVPAPVRIYDVAPTLLDFAGLGRIEGAEGSSLRGLLVGASAATAEPGRSVLQRIFTWDMVARRPNVRDGWRNDRYAVLRRLDVDLAGLVPPLVAVDWLREGGVQVPVEVYDLAEDPAERHPLQPDDPRHAEAVAAFCRAFLAAEDLRLALAAPRPVAAPRASEEEQRILDELGYGGGTSPGEAVQFLAPFPKPCSP